ncbi:MAG TPA: OpgC domain-containing protein [Geminicoccaceae bacterium]|nr:OpgC domain-containing protein [Geminicoccaceae bacterium]
MQDRSASSGRDPRLDFFRGFALLVIFVAHIPWNWYANFIWARYGLSDAADLFVFMSGYAAAIAFGGTFRRAGFLLGTVRIAHRCWQLYVAHLGVFFLIATICIAGNLLFAEPDYIAKLNLYPFFIHTREALVGLFTLTYVPNYFDILPMYMVVLAMVPLAVALGRVHPWLPLAASALLWLANWHLDLNLPAEIRGGAGGWFFNPFAWQLVFFTGFAIGFGWVRAPRPSTALVAAGGLALAAALCVSRPEIYQGIGWLEAVRGWALRYGDKTAYGPLRYLHFLALVYVVVVALKGREHLLLRPPPSLVRKCGQQSLAVFLFGSMTLAWICGMALDQLGRGFAVVTAVNALGLALMVAYAYAAAWLKSQPWRRRPEPQPQRRPAVAAPAWERTRPPAVGPFPIGGVPARERTEAGGD